MITWICELKSPLVLTYWYDRVKCMSFWKYEWISLICDEGLVIAFLFAELHQFILDHNNEKSIEGKYKVFY